MTHCPNGRLADVARGIVKFGANTTKLGANSMKTGAGGMLISLPAVETPVGAAFFAASGITFAAGETMTYIGLGFQSFGGSILYAQGDAQPLRSAALQAAQAKAEHDIGMPPLPIDDPLDAAVEAAAGRDGCQ